MDEVEQPAPADSGQDLLPITKRTAVEEPSSTAHDAKRIKSVYDGPTEPAPDVTTPAIKPPAFSWRVAFPEKVCYHLYLGKCQETF
jgi:hypothetical protein